MFGEAWKSPTADQNPLSHKKKDQSKKHIVDDVEEDSSVSLVVVVALCLLAVIVLVIVGSGGEGTSTNSPKSILFVISGFKGTEFTEAVVAGPYAPNIKKLSAVQGSYAACLHADDGRCCRTQDGPRFGGDYKFNSAPGIASILTGVNSNKHRVNNNSYDAMAHFFTTSGQYPTVLKLAKSKGFSTAVVGSEYMVGTLGETGRCTRFGVVDFECGRDAVTRCLARGSCNSDMRVGLPPSFDVRDTAPVEADVKEYTRAAELAPSDSSRIFELTNEIVNFINAGTDLIVVHINALELASENRAEGGDYSVSSKIAMGTLYLIDSVIGQVAAVVESRVTQSRENWLLLGVSDHAGYQGRSGSVIDEDEMVAFFGSTFTLGGPLKLNAPFPPVRQYDAAPTILKWFGLTQRNTAVTSNAAAADSGAAAATTASALSTSYMDGQAQMICSDGINPGNCTFGDSGNNLN